LPAGNSRRSKVGRLAFQISTKARTKETMVSSYLVVHEKFTKQDRPGGRRAFLLIEVLLAGAILGIALIVLGIAVARCVHGLSVTGNYRMASQVLDERLAFFDRGNDLRQGTWDGAVERDGRTFVWKHEITPTDDPRFFKERVQVSWKQSDGKREESREAYRWKSE
jgi:type II secretion system protein I